MSEKQGIRQLPRQDKRVETGPIQFGEDWPGVFIRGDNAGWYARLLGHLLDENPDTDIQLRELHRLLSGCVIGTAGQILRGEGMSEKQEIQLVGRFNEAATTFTIGSYVYARLLDMSDGWYYQVKGSRVNHPLYRKDGFRGVALHDAKRLLDQLFDGTNYTPVLEVEG
jgi:hypothetical protein